MSYIDGFVAAVPTASRDTYRSFATEAAAVFREHGILNCVEVIYGGFAPIVDV